MTIEELRERMKKLADMFVDSEGNPTDYGSSNEHLDADDLLLEFVGDKEVTKYYNRILKYYA